MTEKTLEELRQEYDAADEAKKCARHAMRREWRKQHPSKLYQAFHEPRNDKGTFVAWYVVLVLLLMLALVMTNIIYPNILYKVGNAAYQLNADDYFECPHDHLQSNITQMITYDGYYYYCPQCGNVMGHLSAWQKHW